MTHPAHTTLITGATPRQHGVVNNRVVDRRTGERFHITNLPRKDSVRVPTLFDAVRTAGGRGRRRCSGPKPKTIRRSTDNVAEVFDEEEMAEPSAVSPTLLTELRKGGVPIDSYYQFYDDPFAQGAADMALTQAAVHVLRTRRPALLALHLLVADKVQHEFGPDALSDRCGVDHGRPLRRADPCSDRDAGLADRTTIAVVGDHGFMTVRDEVNLVPVLVSRPGRTRAMEGGRVVRVGRDAACIRAGADGAALERVLARAAATLGVARVIRPGEFAALGYPEYAANPYVPGQYLIAGDVQTHLVDG